MTLNTGKYVRARVANARAAAVVEVVDLSHPDSKYPPGQIVEARDIHGNPVRVRTARWGAVCLAHEVVCSHARLDDALADADLVTDWCSQCATTERLLDPRNQ